jgi:hypothetical protein
VTRELLFRDGPKVRVSEFFYTIQSLLHGRMTVAWTDRDMMVADREMALIDPRFLHCVRRRGRGR